MSADNEERLRKEAEFQDRRAKSMERGEIESRSRFYFLMDNARACYDSTLFDQKQSGKTIIVVGCSTGGVTPLARLGADVTGVDISSSSIDLLNTAIKDEGLELKARGVLMNAENLTLEDSSIDIVCCSGVLHHLDVEKSIASWALVLKPEGRVRMIEPMALNPIIALYRHFTPSMRTEDEHPLKPKDIKIIRKYYNEVEINGFVLTSLLALVWVILPNIFNLKQKTYNVLEKFDKMLLRAFPFLVYFCWAAVIELRKPKLASSS